MKTNTPQDRLPVDLETLRQWFYIDNAGTVRNRITRGRGGHKALAGSVSGSLNSQGYRQTYIKSVCIRTHHIAFALANGRFPTRQIDHINGIKDDNRPENLREVTNRENSQNYLVHRNGKLPGCGYIKELNKWQAYAYKNGKQKYLGVYDTEESANAAYKVFVKEADA